MKKTRGQNRQPHLRPEAERLPHEVAAMNRLKAKNPEELHLSVVVAAHLRRVMDACGDNVSLAARILDVHRNTMQRWLRSKHPRIIEAFRRSQRPRRG